MCFYFINLKTFIIIISFVEISKNSNYKVSEDYYFPKGEYHGVEDYHRVKPKVSEIKSFEGIKSNPQHTNLFYDALAKYPKNNNRNYENLQPREEAFRKTDVEKINNLQQTVNSKHNVNNEIAGLFDLDSNSADNLSSPSSEYERKKVIKRVHKLPPDKNLRNSQPYRKPSACQDSKDAVVRLVIHLECDHKKEETHHRSYPDDTTFSRERMDSPIQTPRYHEESSGSFQQKTIKSLPGLLTTNGYQYRKVSSSFTTIKPNNRIPTFKRYEKPQKITEESWDEKCSGKTQNPCNLCCAADKMLNKIGDTSIVIPRPLQPHDITAVFKRPTPKSLKPVSHIYLCQISPTLCPKVIKLTKPKCTENNAASKERTVKLESSAVCIFEHNTDNAKNTMPSKITPMTSFLDLTTKVVGEYDGGKATSEKLNIDEHTDDLECTTGNFVTSSKLRCENNLPMPIVLTTKEEINVSPPSKEPYQCSDSPVNGEVIAYETNPETTPYIAIPADSYNDKTFLDSEEQLTSTKSQSCVMTSDAVSFEINDMFFMSQETTENQIADINSTVFSEVISTNVSETEQTLNPIENEGSSDFEFQKLVSMIGNVSTNAVNLNTLEISSIASGTEQTPNSEDNEGSSDLEYNKLVSIFGIVSTNSVNVETLEPTTFVSGTEQTLNTNDNEGSSEFELQRLFSIIGNVSTKYKKLETLEPKFTVSLTEQTLNPNENEGSSDLEFQRLASMIGNVSTNPVSLETLETTSIASGTDQTPNSEDNKGSSNTEFQKLVSIIITNSYISTDSVGIETLESTSIASGTETLNPNENKGSSDSEFQRLVSIVGNFSTNAVNLETLETKLTSSGTEQTLNSEDIKGSSDSEFERLVSIIGNVSTDSVSLETLESTSIVNATGQTLNPNENKGSSDSEYLRLVSIVGNVSTDSVNLETLEPTSIVSATGQTLNPNENKGSSNLEFQRLVTITGNISTNFVSLEKLESTPIQNFPNNSTINDAFSRTTESYMVVETSLQKETELSSFLMHTGSGKINTEAFSGTTGITLSSLVGNNGTDIRNVIDLGGGKFQFYWKDKWYFTDFHFMWPLHYNTSPPFETSQSSYNILSINKVIDENKNLNVQSYQLPFEFFSQSILVLASFDETTTYPWRQLRLSYSDVIAMLRLASTNMTFIPPTDLQWGQICWMNVYSKIQNVPKSSSSEKVAYEVIDFSGNKYPLIVFSNGTSIWKVTKISKDEIVHTVQTFNNNLNITNNFLKLNFSSPTPNFSSFLIESFEEKLNKKLIYSSYFWKTYNFSVEELEVGGRLLLINLSNNTSLDDANLVSNVISPIYASSRKLYANSTHFAFSNGKTIPKSITVYCNGTTTFEAVSLNLDELVKQLKEINRKDSQSEETSLNSSNSTSTTASSGVERKKYNWQNLNSNPLMNVCYPINIGAGKVQFYMKNKWYITDGANVWPFNNILTMLYINEMVKRMDQQFEDDPKLDQNTIQKLVDAKFSDCYYELVMPFQLLAQHYLFFKKFTRGANIPVVYFLKEHSIKPEDVVAVLRLSAFNNFTTKEFAFSWANGGKLNWDWFVYLALHADTERSESTRRYSFSSDSGPFASSPPLKVHLNGSSEWGEQTLNLDEMLTKLQDANSKYNFSLLQINGEYKVKDVAFELLTKEAFRRRFDKSEIYCKYSWNRHSFTWYELLLSARIAELMPKKGRADDAFWVSVIMSIKQSKKINLPDRIYYELQLPSNLEHVTVFMNETTLVKGELRDAVELNQIYSTGNKTI